MDDAETGPIDCGIAALERFLSAHPSVQTLDVVFPDLNGIARGKRLAADAMRAAKVADLTFPSSIYALDTTGANIHESGLILEEGDADRPLRIDFQTLALTPWNEGGAQVLAGIDGDDGRPFFADPRALLQQVEARFEAHGLTPVAAFELEFMLIEPGPGLHVAADAIGTSGVYGFDTLDRYAAFLETVRRHADAQGLPVQAAITEYGQAQFEINLRHVSSALRAADHAFLLKRTLRAAARSVGLEATFMAKPATERSSNGLHLHLSLVDQAGRNRFAEDERALHYALGGLRSTMVEAMLIFAPNPNSYRRFQTLSYAPLAPTWGHNNRLVALRIPAGPGPARRIEHRTAGADANPYLALAAILSGVLHGIEERLDPGPPTTGNAYEKVPPSLPRSLEAALAAFEHGEVLERYLGANFCRLFHTCRQAELDRFQKHVTETELAWYLRTV